MTNNNETWKSLMQQKSEILSRIGAGGQDNAKLRSLTEWLGRELDLEAKYKGLLSEAEQLIAECLGTIADGSGTQEAPKPIKSDTGVTWTLGDLGKNERARIARRAFFARQKQKGKNYNQVGRIYYRNDDGVVLGITFSSDKGNGSWFLNLKAGKFQEAVLLCQSGPTTVKALHLPKAIVAGYADAMSEDHKGEIKFNVRREADRFLLDIPQPVGPVDVTSLVDKEELICHRDEFQC